MICPNCNKKIVDRAQFCIHCGQQFTNNVTNTSQLVPTPEDIEISKRNTIWLVIAIINQLAICPLILTFAGFWTIFGAFAGSAAEYYGILFFCLGYLLFSLIFVVVRIVRSVSHSVKNDKKTSKFLKYVVILFFVTVVVELIVLFIKYF